MRKQLKPLLQKLFGFNNYLLAYSLYSIRKSQHGKYEEEFECFIRMIPPTGLILDIGANIGITAITLSRSRKKAEVHAFEPIQENFKTLQRVSSIYHANNLELYNLALGNSSGILKMIMPVKNHARQQGLSRVYNEEDSVEGAIYTVAVKTLDEIYADFRNIVAIKIDVENYEYEVLKGAENVLKTCRPIIYCELWRNEKRQMVFDYMLYLNYELYIYDEVKKEVQKINNRLVDNIYNFFFIPEDMHGH